MSTLGFRGSLAALFTLSLGLAAGSSQGAGTPGFAPRALDGPGVFDRLQALACELNRGGAAREGSASAKAVREDCRRRHGLD